MKIPNEEKEQNFTIASFPRMNIEKTYAIFNLGTLYLIIAFNLLWAFVLKIASLFNIKWEWLNKKVIKWRQEVFWGAIIRLAVESCLS